MAFVDEAVAKEYREAFDAWQKQIENVHRVFLEGESLRPDALKGLLKPVPTFNVARLKEHA